MYSNRNGKDVANFEFAASCFCSTTEVQLALRRLDREMSRRGFIAGMAASMLSLALPQLAGAQNPPPAKKTPLLLHNFRLFDGKTTALRDGLFLQVDDNRIGRIGQGPLPGVAEAKSIDCGGRTLMPGLIDTHWHSMLAALPFPVLIQADLGYINLAASVEAHKTLLRGFTTVRDAGGPSFALKQAIDAGMVPGPRIFPSGVMITTTGGHGDFRPFSEFPKSSGAPGSLELQGGNAIADSAEEVRLRVREQLTRGASQVKLVAGGGVATPRSPLDMLTFTEDQLRSAVNTARDWGTYVLAHSYTPPSIKRCIAAGVQCIEHAHLMDEETAALMAKNGTWLSTQPFVEDDDFPPLTGPSLVRQRQIIEGTDRLYKMAKKHGIKTAFSTDLLFSPVLAQRQGRLLAHLVRWYSAAEALQMATATNAQLLALSGPRNPYPAGKLGVIEDGAYADLLLVDGNPLADIELITRPDQTLKLIIKDGNIYKNTLPS